MAPWVLFIFRGEEVLVGSGVGIRPVVGLGFRVQGP